MQIALRCQVSVIYIGCSMQNLFFVVWHTMKMAEFHEGVPTVTAHGVSWKISRLV